jgi:hypothetical protein
MPMYSNLYSGEGPQAKNAMFNLNRGGRYPLATKYQSTEPCPDRLAPKQLCGWTLYSHRHGLCGASGFLTRNCSQLGAEKDTAFQEVVKWGYGAGRSTGQLDKKASVAHPIAFCFHIRVRSVRAGAYLRMRLFLRARLCARTPARTHGMDGLRLPSLLCGAS